MTRRLQYRWLRKAFSYIKKFFQADSDNKQIDIDTRHHPAPVQHNLNDQNPPNPSLVSTVDSNVTVTLAGSQRPDSLDLRPLSTRSQVSTGSKSASQRCHSPCHQYLDSSEETPSSHQSIEDNALLLSLESDGDESSTDGDTGKTEKGESTSNAGLSDSDNVPTPRASTEFQKHGLSATVTPANIATTGPSLRINPVPTNLNPIQEVSSSLSVNEPPAPVNDRVANNTPEAEAPVSNTENKGQHDTTAAEETPNVDTSQSMRFPEKSVLSNWQPGESSAMAAARACHGSLSRTSPEHLQEETPLPADLRNWKGKKPLRYSYPPASERSNQERWQELHASSSEPCLAQANEGAHVHEDKNSKNLDVDFRRPFPSTDDPLDTSEADVYGHFPREPVSPPPLRPPTPPGMPRFGSPEAMNTDFNNLKRDRSFKGLRRSISNRFSKRRRSEGDQDGIREGRLSQSRQGQDSRPATHTTDNATINSETNASRPKREKGSFFSKISRFFRFRSRRRSTSSSDIPHQSRPASSFSCPPSRRSSLRRYPKGVIDRAPDGTYVRASFPIRSSGHGVGGVNRLP